MRIQFFGAAGQVTGSKHLITTDADKRILLDCGLFQGNKQTAELNRHFGFDPLAVDVLVLSHGHIDHAGLIPRLYKEGFRGKIYCTTGTYELCKLILADSAHIQEGDLTFVNKRRKKRGEPPLDPLYDIKDVEGCLKLFLPFPYETPIVIDDETELMFTDAGHVIGSAVVNLKVQTARGVKHITFTGDIGRQEDKILRSPQPFPQCDILICESTYGDRLHEKDTDSDPKLLELVTETCVKQRGKLIIPAFSVDRTQELIYQLEKMENDGLLPQVKVYVDSPLSVKATGIMRNGVHEYNEAFKAYMQKDPAPFCFRNLVFITDVNESKKLNESKEPCIIISASGMAEAGRVKHHIKNNIGDERNTILIVGYCTPDSLGGRLSSGNKLVRIFGDEYAVKAKVAVFDSYSAHADYEEIFTFLKCQDKKRITKIFLVHGEPATTQIFRDKFLERGYQNIFIPSQAQNFDL